LLKEIAGLYCSYRLYLLCGCENRHFLKELFE
jgi:hypothetical protein